MNPTKKILITGGAGFIGSNLANRLIQEGHNVFVLDNLSNGNLANLSSEVNLIEGDTRLFSSSLGDLAPDLIFHLGEYSRVEQSFESPSEVLTTNITGTANVLDYCLNNRDVKLVYCGSSTRFGLGESPEFSSPYALTKYANAHLVERFCSWFGIEHVITYFYNVYGPGEVRSGSKATFIGVCEDAYLNRRKIWITRPGTQLRNFTHIEDTINGLIIAANLGSGDGFGIAAKESYSLCEVAKMFDLEVEFRAARPGGRSGSELKNEKLSKLGWEQQHNLEAYINRFRRDIDEN